MQLLNKTCKWLVIIGNLALENFPILFEFKIDIGVLIWKYNLMKCALITNKIIDYSAVYNYQLLPPPKGHTNI